MGAVSLSTIKSQTDLLHQVGMRVLKMAMDNATAQAGEFIQALEQSNKAMELSVRPDLGSNIDFKV